MPNRHHVVFLTLTTRMAAAETAVNRIVAPDDHMASKNLNHYFNVGQSATHCICTAMAMSGRTEIASVLDFGCGWGRVARWLRALFPEAQLTVSDVREDAIAFCADAFAATPWRSAADVTTLVAPRSFDLIWCGSLLTHLAEATSLAFLDRFYAWLAPNGLMLVTTHGRRVLKNQRLGRNKYISDVKFAAIEEDYRRKGYGYADYDGRQGLGLSLTSTRWLADWSASQGDARLISISERAWDNHHDVIAVQKSET